MQKSFFADQVDLNIALDPSTSFPLYSEQEKILELIMNYVPLPYSVTEFGCGNKCTMIIQQLIDLGIPSFAIERGMIMEKDMSPEALAQKNYLKRPHALTVENILYHKINFADEVLVTLLREEGITVDTKKNVISTGPYSLTHKKTVQFVKARSHVFPLVFFWDEKEKEVRQMVIDPTLDQDEFFMLSQLRKYLHSSESLIFTAPLMGEFMLDEAFMTEAQHKEFQQLTGRSHIADLSRADYCSLVRKMNKAEKGSIHGDLCR